MENKVIQDRLALLRKKMQEESIDLYMMPTADFHNSEYVNDYFKVREYFCNFTGSNGTLLVWKDGAGLWTDGRYFIQAEAELEGTTVELFRMLQEGVPTIEEFLEQNMEQGQTLGFDGRVIPTKEGCEYEKKLAEKKPMVQMLQPPVILTLTMQEEEAVKNNMTVFEELGYQIEPFGGREYAVSGVPSHLPHIGNEELLKEVIDTLVDEHDHRTPDILKDKIASMSCKAAVKGNNRLPREQMEELLRELMTLENPYHCPHGRPTMIKMTKTEMDKKFKRIV